jgi:transaldolase/glucose-6-phosphate isomerase
MNPLKQLWEQKQSFWLDFIRRNLLTSGELKKLIDEDGLRGMTSNPTIFEKAISSGSEYDAQLKKLASQGKTVSQVFEDVAVTDIQKAADILKIVYTASQGTDGFVSLEVNPDLAYDTHGTIQEAKKLWKKVNRPNLMIKVPATKEGIPAVEELIFSGVNVNITLLFSVQFYKAVLEAYTRGLERRVKKNLPIKKIASVASFFVSRVDTIIDKQLDQKISMGGYEAEVAKPLLHKAAIANAKLAYAHYESVVASPRFEKLKKKGAQVQRLLWASTGTKDKRLSDVIYINELVGPDTVNTIPPQTADAFRDHGTVMPTLKQGWAQAQTDLSTLATIGIDLEKSMQQLQDEGVKSFSISFETLMRVVAAKCEILTGGISKSIKFQLGSYENEFQKTIAKIKDQKWVERIWEKDPTVWKTEAEHQAIIKNSLGWLTVPNHVKRNLLLLENIKADIKKAKFTHILLLGMGGSSLCPEVLRLTFGKKTGFPDLAILDSTEPASVSERAARSKPEKTLYIVASKSGSTSEPNAFLATFYDAVAKKKGGHAGDHFIAITDPGTSMHKLAQDKKFRHIVINPPDIGGRYSALSFFGMLPAALMGLPVSDLLENAIQMAGASSGLVPAEKNPSALLGAALGSLALQGRDKVTFALSPDIASFSTWVEQLIAESTGKEGKGILPVESEDISSPDAYGHDRVFISIQTKSNASLEKKFAALKKAGHPVIQIQLKSKLDMAGQLFQWEFATAVAGAVLAIDSFDQPNVQESKDLTKRYLEEFKTKHSLSVPSPQFRENGISALVANGAEKASNLEEAVQDLLANIKEGDYVALLAYLNRNDRHWKILQEIRHAIMKAKKVATTVGFGPRFLHSTGQLHKGGSNAGVFVQITGEDEKDLAIPGEVYGYSVLKEAQALGDLSALMNRHRRVIRIHLKHGEKDLLKLRDMILKITHN